MTHHRDTDWTLQICQACGGEGRIYYGGYVYEPGCSHAHWGDYRDEHCAECDGTGGALVPCELIELEDLESLPQG